jgi:hypothetical protein
MVGAKHITAEQQAAAGAVGCKTGEKMFQCFKNKPN